MRLFFRIIISQGSQGISAPYTLTLPARSSVLYLCDWKIRKNPNHFQFGKSGSDYTGLVRVTGLEPA